MKYVIEVSYSLTLEFKDFDDFTSAQSMLIAGGVRKFDVKIIDEKEADND